MGILKRVFIGIKRYKGRVFILFMSTFLIGVLVSGFITINQAIDSSIEHLQRSMPFIFSITFNENDSDANQAPLLVDRSMIHEIGNLPYVSHFDYTFLYHARGYYQSYWLDQLNMGSRDDFSDFDLFHVYGISRPEVIYIESGMYELYTGRLFTTEEMQSDGMITIAPVLVSRQFAELNNLWIGSQVQLMNKNLFMLPEHANVPEGGFTGMYWGETLWEHPYNQSQDVLYDFEIVGIFEFTRIERGTMSELLHHQTLINAFFTPNWRVHEIIRDFAESWQLWADVFNMHDWEEGVVEEMQLAVDAMIPLWILDDLDDLEAFRVAANAILPTYFEIDDGLIEVVRPMIDATDNLNTTVSQVLWIGGGVMIVVLTLLILLYLRERQHELGIYLALGEKKIKLVVQMLLEVFTISAIGLTMSLLVATVVAENVSMSMLRTELASMMRSEDHFPSTFEFMGIAQEPTIDEMMEHFNVSLDTKTIVLFFVVASGVVIVSTVASVVYILELNPKDILMKAKIE